MILALAGVAFVMGAILTSFDGSLPKVEGMQSSLARKAPRLDNAKHEYLADIEKTRANTPDRIMLNSQRLATVKAHMDIRKYDQDYLKKITSLEKKNKELRYRMMYYRADGIDNWKVFKGNFNRELDELTKACRALAEQATSER